MDRINVTLPGRAGRRGPAKRVVPRRRDYQAQHQPDVLVDAVHKVGDEPFDAAAAVGFGAHGAKLDVVIEGRGGLARRLAAV